MPKAIIFLDQARLAFFYGNTFDVDFGAFFEFDFDDDLNEY